jgi:23S rRNA (guanosine2251-2'-O)-methyltransferase
VISIATLSQVAAQLKTRDVALIGAIQKGKVDYDRADWTKPSALVMGSEGSGFTREELVLFNETIRIPMAGAVESLNVGSAAAICLFEAARQRRVATADFDDVLPGQRHPAELDAPAQEP